MDIGEYKDKKVKGLAEVVKAGGGYALAIKQYDQDDGAELSPEIESVDIIELTAIKTKLEAEVADYEELIADIETIDKLKELKEL